MSRAAKDFMGSCKNWSGAGEVEREDSWKEKQKPHAGSSAGLVKSGKHPALEAERPLLVKGKVPVQCPGSSYRANAEALGEIKSVFLRGGPRRRGKPAGLKSEYVVHGRTNVFATTLDFNRSRSY